MVTCFIHINHIVFVSFDYHYMQILVILQVVGCFYQTPGQVFSLEVDFVLPLPQEEEEQQQQSHPNLPEGINKGYQTTAIVTST